MKQNKRAFTLIELLVVILIIGILAAVALPQYQKAVDKARASELFALVKNLKVQQEVFFLANGHYAADCEELGADLPSGFIQSDTDTTAYRLNRGIYTTAIKCANGGNTRVYGGVSSSDGNFQVNIEIYFDHYLDEDASSRDQGRQGKMFCNSVSQTARGLAVCKSLSSIARAAGGFWLN